MGETEVVVGDGDAALAGSPLLESRGELEAILRQVADGITVQDASGSLVYANDAAARLIGFANSAELMATPVPEVMARFEMFDDLQRDVDGVAGRQQASRETLGERFSRDEAKAALADRRYAGRVDESTREAQRHGIHAIPAFVLGGRLLLLGAHPHEVFERAMAQLGPSDAESA